VQTWAVRSEADEHRAAEILHELASELRWAVGT
jgi:hypothetical protein